MLIAFFLAVEAMRRTFAHSYAEHNPVLALQWVSGDVGAREILANRRSPLRDVLRQLLIDAMILDQFHDASAHRKAMKQWKPPKLARAAQ